MALTPMTGSLNYIDVLMDSRKGKAGNFTRVAVKMNMQVWNNIIDLTAAALEKEREEREVSRGSTLDKWQRSSEIAEVVKLP